jgi:hypothetical protein
MQVYATYDCRFGIGLMSLKTPLNRLRLNNLLRSLGTFGTLPASDLKHFALVIRSNRHYLIAVAAKSHPKQFARVCGAITSIANSAAITLELLSTSSNSGLYTDCASISGSPSTSPLSLTAGDPISVDLNYSGHLLGETLIDIHSPTQRPTSPVHSGTQDKQSA